MTSQLPPLPVCLDAWQAALHPATGSTSSGIRAIVEAVFGTACSITKLSEDYYNELYRIALTSRTAWRLPASLLCRVSKQAKIESCLDFASEVETMRYLREARELTSVPRVYAYCTNGNLLRLRFLIMENSSDAQPLDTCWKNFDDYARRRTITDYAQLVYNLSHVERRHCIAAIRWQPGQEPTFVAPVTYAKHSYLAIRPSHREQHARGRLSLPEAWISQLFGNAEDYYNGWLSWNAKQIKRGVQGLSREKRDQLVKDHEALKECLQSARNAVRWWDASGGPCCIVNRGMRAGDILVTPSGKNAGQIRLVLNWEHTNMCPVWMCNYLPRLESFITTHIDLINSFMTELMKADAGGVIRTWAVGRRYQILRWLIIVLEAPDAEQVIKWTESFRRTDRDAGRSRCTDPDPRQQAASEWTDSLTLIKDVVAAEDQAVRQLHHVKAPWERFTSTSRPIASASGTAGVSFSPPLNPNAPVFVPAPARPSQPLAQVRSAGGDSSGAAPAVQLVHPIPQRGQVSHAARTLPPRPHTSMRMSAHSRTGGDCVIPAGLKNALFTKPMPAPATVEDDSSDEDLLRQACGPHDQQLPPPLQRPKTALERPKPSGRNTNPAHQVPNYTEQTWTGHANQATGEGSRLSGVDRTGHGRGIGRSGRGGAGTDTEGVGGWLKRFVPRKGEPSLE